MAAFFYEPTTGNFRLRVNAGTTSIRFSACSSAGNFYRMGFQGLGPGGTTYSVYKNFVDASSATGTSHYTTNISVLPNPAPQRNNSPTRFTGTEVNVTATTNTDYVIEWQDIRFQGLVNPIANPYPIGSFTPLSPQAAGASINAGSTVLGGATLYPYANSVFGQRIKRGLFVLHLSAWRTITTNNVFHLGAWRTVTNGFIFSGGAWRAYYRNYNTTQVLTINEPGADELDFAVEVQALN